MKLTNYRRNDIETVIETKKLIMQQIEALEICNWTDDLDSAIVRSEVILESFGMLRELKYSKALGDQKQMLAAKLQAQGINAQAFILHNKKAE